LKSNPKTARCRNQQEIDVSNYVQSTNFATKDALPSGDPLKIVKGTEINTEFNNIAVAVATKADLLSPTFTGTPFLPTGTTSVTQGAGNNSTALSTTAYTDAAIAAAKQALYPVGSIYINAGVTTNPATLLGFGTWVAFGAGRVMVGLDGSDALFDTLEETGGSKDAIVVSHTHTATTNSTGSHNHTVTTYDFAGAHSHSQSPYPGGIASAAGGTGASNTSAASSTAGEHSHTFTTNATGSSATNANLQPYITVAMWKRTA
jgi:hypothetical protein